MAISVRFVSYEGLLAANLQQPEDRVQYPGKLGALEKRKVGRRLDGLSTMK